MSLFAHFQDLVDAYVGPFDNQAQIDEHIKFVEARGDSAAYLGSVTSVPEGEFVMSVAEDRAFTYDDHGL